MLSCWANTASPTHKKPLWSRSSSCFPVLEQFPIVQEVKVGFCNIRLVYFYVCLLLLKGRKEGCDQLNFLKLGLELRDELMNSFVIIYYYTYIRDFICIYLDGVFNNF